MNVDVCETCVSHTDSRLAALAQAIMQKTDPYTAHHQERVARFAVVIAKAMGLTACQRVMLYYAGIVHDLGKIAIPHEILSKPTRLSEVEKELIKTHVEHGVEILKSVGFCDRVIDTIANHHERLDGKGYPNAVSSDAISLESRILTVADVFEAITAHRPYRPSLGSEAALSELRSNVGTKYDKDVVSVLEHLLVQADNQELMDLIGE